MSTGDLAPLNGWVPSPNDAWHQDISSAPVASNSSTIVSAAQDLNGAYLHPDFGSPADGGYGIPYTVVDTSTNSVPLVSISASVSTDSDNTLYPLSSSMPIEGSPGQCWTDSADHHAIVIDKNQCVGYEIYQANLCNGAWTSYADTVWDFNTTEERPYGLTSTDAAGLSVFEGLVRYDEIVAGSINHAIRFTAQHTKTDAANGYFTAPATHAAGNLVGTDNIMGMRIRLKASFDVSGYSTTNQIILNAMKKYGMILADNGSNMFFQGTPDPRWNDSDLHALAQVPATAFEVVQMGGVYDANSAPTGAAPVINSFTASSPTVAPGGSVTLTSNVTNGTYQFIDKAGFTRGSITVSPTQTTTYTLTARNIYGTSTASTTVTVSSSAAPTLAFSAIAPVTYGTAPFSISATSNSPGAITYTAVSGPATVSGNTVTVNGVGNVTVRATQAASGSYPSTTTTTSFTVNPATPSMAFTTISGQTVGANPFSISATSNSTGAITYSVVSGPATISGNTVTVTGAGTVTLMASQTAAGDFTTGSTTTSFVVSNSTSSSSGTATTPVSTASSTSSIGAVSSVPSTAGGIASTPASSDNSSTSTSTSSSGATTTSTAGTSTSSSAVGGATSTPVGGATSTTPSQSASSSPSTGPVSITTKLTLTSQRTKNGYQIHATSNSPGAITYSLVSGSATISGNNVYPTRYGTIKVRATQAASGNYSAASATITFTVGL